MSSPSPTSTDNTTTQSALIIVALNTIFQYFTDEVDVDHFFNRLLWPSRYYSSFGTSTSIGRSVWDVIKVGLLLPGGGPMTRPAVRVLGQMFENGLFEGRLRGNVLGTVFFEDYHKRCEIYTTTPDTARTTTSTGIENKETGNIQQDKELRNNFWWPTMQILTFKGDGKLVPPSSGTPPMSPTEKPLLIKGNEGSLLKKMNVQTAVYIVSLKVHQPINSTSNSKGQKPKPKLETIPIYDTSPTLPIQAWLGIIISESVALAMGIFVRVYFNSWFCWLWFAPLMLKLTSAWFMVERQLKFDEPAELDYDDKDKGMGIGKGVDDSHKAGITPSSSGSTTAYDGTEPEDKRSGGSTTIEEALVTSIPHTPEIPPHQTVNVSSSSSDVPIPNSNPIIKPISDHPTQTLQYHTQESILHFPKTPKHSFLLLRAPSQIAFHLTRHHGHPQRHLRHDRFLEMIQIFIILGFAALTPLGLLLTVLMMEETLQYTWLAYQVYTVVAYPVGRFLGANVVGSSMERVARELMEVSGKGGGGGESILLDYEGKVTLEAKLETIIVNRVKDGNSVMSEKLEDFKSGKS